MASKNKVYSILKKTYKKWRHDKASDLGAALSFYSIFSIIPLIIVMVILAGTFFNLDAESSVFEQLQKYIGSQNAMRLKNLLDNWDNPVTERFGIPLGAMLLIYGGAKLLSHLQESLNVIFACNRRRGLKGFFVKRAISFGVVLMLGFVFLAMLAASSLISILQRRIETLLPGFNWVFQWSDFFISLAVLSIITAILFKMLPDCRMRWKHVWAGAFLTSLLFNIGKLVIQLYLGYSNIASSFGAASFLVVVMIWVYYSSQILFLGAEFTYAYSSSEKE